jgi:integrase
VLPSPPNGADLPPGNTSAALWKALADAAIALHAVASALAGSPVPSGPIPLSISHARPPDSTVTVVDAINELLTSKARAGRSDAYLRQLRIGLADFARGRSRHPLDSITPADVEAWLTASVLSPRTRKGRLQYVGTLFGFGVRRGYCARNPASAVDVPAQRNDPPGIHTPAQVRAVMSAAMASSPRLTRMLAIRYFGGLRTAEAARLEESDIGPKYITVTASKAKTRRRRLVPIHPTLRAWLDLGGEVPGTTCEQSLWELTRRIAVPWPRNCARHSFVSYHLAAFGSASQTALIAGHSEAMLFAHYRELVTPEDAAEFWSITPEVGPLEGGAVL